jgi:hypothetical protein
MTHGSKLVHLIKTRICQGPIVMSGAVLQNKISPALNQVAKKKKSPRRRRMTLKDPSL